MNIALKFEDEDSVNILAKQHQQDEAVIDAGLKAFFEVGFALMRIRDSKSYKEVDGFNTFAEYCQVKWDMSKSHANYQISASMVIVNLRNDNFSGQIPERETHVRPLSYLKPELQCKVWRAVVEASVNTGKKITGKLVKEVMYALPEFNPDPDIVDEINRSMGDGDIDADAETKYKREQSSESFKKEWDQNAKGMQDGLDSILEFLKKMGLSGTSMDDFYRNFPPSSKVLFHEFILSGYRDLAKKHHPDHGGSTDKMSQIGKINTFFKAYVDGLFS